jgi:hypothetical protein
VLRATLPPAGDAPIARFVPHAATLLAAASTHMATHGLFHDINEVRLRTLAPSSVRRAKSAGGSGEEPGVELAASVAGAASSRAPGAGQGSAAGSNAAIAQAAPSSSTTQLAHMLNPPRFGPDDASSPHGRSTRTSNAGNSLRSSRPSNAAPPPQQPATGGKPPTRPAALQPSAPGPAAPKRAAAAGGAGSQQKPARQPAPQKPGASPATGSAGIAARAAGIAGASHRAPAAPGSTGSGGGDASPYAVRARRFKVKESAAPGGEPQSGRDSAASGSLSARDRPAGGQVAHGGQQGSGSATARPAPPPSARAGVADPRYIGQLPPARAKHAWDVGSSPYSAAVPRPK